VWACDPTQVQLACSTPKTEKRRYCAANVASQREDAEEEEEEEEEEEGGFGRERRGC
jgi:hypothetical protein